MHRIRVTLEGNSVTDWTVTSPRVSIGSGDDADIRLDAARHVSANHAHVELQNDGAAEVIAAEGERLGLPGGSGEAVPVDRRRLESGQGVLVGDYLVSWESVTSDDITPADYFPAQEPITPTLTVMDGPDKGQTFALARIPATIGRAEDNDIRLSDRSVSRHHATVTRDERGFLLSDAKSTYGIRAGNSVTSAVRLLNGTAVSLGDTRLVFEGPAPAAPDGNDTEDTQDLVRAPRLTPQPKTVDMSKTDTLQRSGLPGAKGEVPRAIKPLLVLAVVAVVAIGAAAFWFWYTQIRQTGP